MHNKEEIMLEIIMECFNDLQEDDFIANIITDYSGRGMCGEKCIGIVPEADDFDIGLRIGQWVEKHYPIEAEAVLDALSINRIDSLGKKTIIYFPRLKVKEEA